MKEVSLSILESCKKTLVRPHPAGIPFIAGGAVAAVILLLLWDFAGMLALLFTLFCLYFFRDPARVVPQDASLIVSPADGRISAIEENARLPEEIADEGEGATYTRISIFLSVLDVHVNRSPAAGKIVRKVYKPGKFFNADLDKASEFNERCSALIETEDGAKIGVVQIAGLIARRILNDLADGQTIAAGARFGIIRFGSRVDVYVPQGAFVPVCVGQRAIGGETVLAERGRQEAFRKGVTV